MSTEIEPANNAGEFPTQHSFFINHKWSYNFIWMNCMFFKLSNRIFKCYAFFPNQNLLEIDFLQKRYNGAFEPFDWRISIPKWCSFRRSRIQVKLKGNFTVNCSTPNPMDTIFFPLVENVICPFLAIASLGYWRKFYVVTVDTERYKFY